MLISEAITYCEYMTGQVVASEQLVRWLSELDGRLAFEFYRTGEWAPYDPTDDTGAELLVPFPWDGLYVHHLAAKTYFSNGEYDRYENERVMSEQTLADFRSFMQRTQAALCGCGFPTDKTGGTYVTVIPEQASSLWFWIDAYSLAVKHGFSGTEEEWLASLVGPKGNDGERGADGSSFTIKGLYATYAALISAHPTGSEGDAYAVGTAEENTTYNWDVDAEEWVDIGPFRGQKGDEGPAGQDGAPGQDGQDGAPGQDGVSPEVTISTITGGHSVNITDADHPGGQTFNVMDGQDGTDGTDGNDGADGVSPAVSVSSITGGHTVTITDKDHPNGQSFNVMDGTDGTDGQDGAPGPNTVTSSTTTNLTGLLAGDGSTVTTMGLDTSTLSNDVNHIPASSVVKSALNFVPETGNAGWHNSIYRGKYLGSSVTAAQYSAISAGTFNDMFIGDYWTIGGVTYRIAHFDYWLHCGDTKCTTHHVVIVPDSNFTAAKMNNSNVTTGGYHGCDMRTGANSNTGLSAAKTTIETAFGSSHILSHRELLTNAVSGDKASGWAWYDSTVDLMNEVMVYGCHAWGSAPGYETGIDKSQLALFALAPEFICNRAGWWLRDVVSSAVFAFVGYGGYADNTGASYSFGVRPAFAIKA